MDALSGTEGWDVCLSYDNNGKLQGALPYYLLKRRGFTLIKNPPLATYLSLWLQYPESPKLHRRYSFERNVLTDLIDQLPSALLYDFQFDPALTNCLPFHWAGFQQTTRYTYLLEGIDDPPQRFREMEGAVRTHIRKARSQLTFRLATSTEPLLQVLQKSYQHKKMRLPFVPSRLEQLHHAAQSRAQGAIFLAVDEQEQVHTAAFVVWDEHRANYLLNGSDPTIRQTGANYFLFWEIVKYLAKQSRELDLEGSMLPLIEPVFSSFGARQTPYFRLIRFQNKWIERLYYLSGKNN